MVRPFPSNLTPHQEWGGQLLAERLGVADGAGLGQRGRSYQLWPKIEAIVFGCHVVAWNLEHEIEYLKLLPKAAEHMSCAMKRCADLW